ncbi:unnamed protein product, partial [Strongylus vulgaris]
NKISIRNDFIRFLFQRDTIDPIPSEKAIAEAKRLADESLDFLKKVAERARGMPVEYPKAPFEPRRYLETFEGKNGEVETEIKILSLGDNNGACDFEGFEEKDDLENGTEQNFVESCDPCNVPQCPLNPADQERGKMGDLDTDEDPEDAKGSDDWDRRVIVRRRELVPEEEAKLPWHKPPLDMYRRVTEAIHGLDMIKASNVT